jgi:hypothetical protein
MRLAVEAYEPDLFDGTAGGFSSWPNEPTP